MRWFERTGLKLSFFWCETEGGLSLEESCNYYSLCVAVSMKRWCGLSTDHGGFQVEHVGLRRCTAR